MLPLIVVGIFLVLLSFFIGSDFGVQALGGEHPTMEFWTLWVGIGCIVAGIAFLLFALIFGATAFAMSFRD